MSAMAFAKPMTAKKVIKLMKGINRMKAKQAMKMKRSLTRAEYFSLSLKDRLLAVPNAD